VLADAAAARALQAFSPVGLLRKTIAAPVGI
jgi:hypothetical protein